MFNMSGIPTVNTYSGFALYTERVSDVYKLQVCLAYFMFDNRTSSASVCPKEETIII